MDYKELADRLKKKYKANETGSTFVTLCSRRDVINAADTITELLARAEAAEAALKREKSYHTPLPPFDDDDPDVLYCQKCGSGEYLENEDGNRNNYCGQCGQRIDWAAYDAAIEAISGTGGD